jgi:hypothetical protein
VRYCRAFLCAPLPRARSCSPADRGSAMRSCALLCRARGAARLRIADPSSLRSSAAREELLACGSRCAALPCASAREAQHAPLCSCVRSCCPCAAPLCSCARSCCPALLLQQQGLSSAPTRSPRLDLFRRRGPLRSVKKSPATCADLLGVSLPARNFGTL